MNDEEIIEYINNEIFKNVNNKEKKAKPHIFNNKKNNNEFPNLLRLAINTVKGIISYAISKRKTKIKTLNEIGIANGIYYPTTNIIKGILSEKDNYKVIIREKDENKYNAKKIISLRKIIYILKMQNIKIIFLICLLFAFSFYTNEVKNTFVTQTNYIFR